MNAIKFETAVGEATATAIPALRPLLGNRVQLIVLQPEADFPGEARRKLTLTELKVLLGDGPQGPVPQTDDDILHAAVESVSLGELAVR